MKDKRRKQGLKQEVISVICIAVLIAAGGGCRSTGKALVQSAGDKNLDANGFLLLGSIEASSPENGFPVGKLITGRVSYKSRKLAIPEGYKVPAAGNFRAVRSRSLFGTEEIIIEYDYSAPDEETGEEIREDMERRKSAAAALFTGKEENEP